MASGLSGAQQIFAAVLVAGIIGVGSGVMSGILYHPEELQEAAYKIEVPEAAAAAVAAAPVEEPPIGILLASADVAAGEKAAKKCAACHSFDKGGPNRVGPGLWGVLGRDIANHEGFTYSGALEEKPGAWDYESLNGFLKSPKGWAEGTKMAFSGLEKADERAGIILYLRSLADAPAELPPAEAPAAEAAPAAATPAAAPAPAEATPAESPTTPPPG